MTTHGSTISSEDIILSADGTNPEGEEGWSSRLPPSSCIGMECSLYPSKVGDMVKLGGDLIPSDSHVPHVKSGSFVVFAGHSSSLDYTSGHQRC